MCTRHLFLCFITFASFLQHWFSKQALASPYYHQYNGMLIIIGVCAKKNQYGNLDLITRTRDCAVVLTNAYCDSLNAQPPNWYNGWNLQQTSKWFQRRFVLSSTLRAWPVDSNQHLDSITFITTTSIIIVHLRCLITGSDFEMLCIMS